MPYKHLQTTSFVSESEENIFSCDLWYYFNLCHMCPHKCAVLKETGL